MATLSMIVRVAANMAELKRNLSEGKDVIDTTTSAMNKMVASFQGEKLIQHAHNYAAAINQLGGVERLNAQEKERVNAVITKAIEKYQLLGKEAPTALLKIQKETTTQTSLFDKFMSKLGPLGPAIVGAFSATAIIGAAKQVLNFADQLENLSAKTGISTTGLQKFQLAFQQSGVSLDTVATNVTKLAKTLIDGDKGAVGAITKLGLSVAQLKTLAPEEQFIKVADAIGNIQNPTEKAYAAMAVFGKGGAELLQGLDGHLAETTKKFEDMGLIIDEKTVKAADAFGDQLGLMGKQLLAIIATALTPLLPLLSALGTALLWIGQNVIGPVLSGAIKALTGGVLGLYAAFAELLAWLANLATKIPIVGKHLGFMGDAAEWLRGSSTKAMKAIQDMWAETDHAGASASKAAPSLIGLGNANDEAARKAKAHREAIESIRAAQIPLTDVQQAAIAGLERLGISQGEIAKALTISEVAVKNYTDAHKAMNETIAKGNAFALKEQERIVKEQAEIFKRAIDFTNARVLKNLQVGVDAERSASEQIRKLTLNDVDFKLSQIQVEADARRALLQEGVAGYNQALAAIEHDMAAKMAAVRHAHNDEVEKMKDEVNSWGNIFRGAIDGIPRLLQAAFTGGGGFGGALKGVASGLGGDLVGKLFGAGGGGFGNALTKGIAGLFGQGAASGLAAAIGSVLPGIGTAIGALAGPLIGKIGGFFKSLFGGGEGKEVTKLRAQFEQAAGGVDALRRAADAAGVSLDVLYHTKKVKEFQAAAQSVQAQIEAFQKRVAEFPSAFETMLGTVGGQLASPQFFQLLAQIEDTGKLTAEIAAFRTQQTQSGIAGLVSFLQTAATAQTTLAAKTKELGAVQADYNDKLRRGFSAGSAEMDALRDRIRILTGEVRTHQQLIAATGVTTQQAADGMSAALLAAFEQLRRGGMTVTQALAAIAPGVDALGTQLTATGLKGGAAFEQIQTWVNLSKDAIAGPALNAVSSLNQGLVGLSNAGLMNQTIFAGLAGQVAQTFHALVTQGVQGNDALALMQPTLQTIWQLQQDFGLQVDDSTQLMLDQAIAAGLVGDAHRSANERAALAMERVATLLEDFLRSLGAIQRQADSAAGAVSGVADAVEDIPTDITVSIDFEIGDIPDLPSFDNITVDVPGDAFHRGGLIRAHRGMYLGPDEVPIIAQTGEGMLSRAGMEALGGPGVLEALNSGRRSAGGGQPIVIHLRNELDGKVLTRRVIELMPGELSRHGLLR